MVLKDRAWVAKMGTRDDWLAKVSEAIIDPAREIIDPHHHFWNRGGFDYELDQLWADTETGHNITKTVFIECQSKYDYDAPEHLRPVGETRYADRLARLAALDKTRAQVAGIVAHADLRGPHLDAVLDAHLVASPLLRGIRQAAARDPDPAQLAIAGTGAPGLYRDENFRAGLARLGERGLTYDAWHYHHQNRDFYDLARAVPGTTMILNHFGTPLGVGRFKGRRDEIFARWKDDVAALAECPNVVAKLGGFAMPDNGWDWHERVKPPTSDDLIAAQGPWYHHMIACFGADRAMFESNFPVDRVSISYAVLWNAFKKIAANYDEAAQEALLAATARRIYRL